MNKGLKITIIVILTICLVGGIAFACYWLYMKNKPTPQENGEKTDYYQPTEEEIARAKELEKILREKLPTIDGSTSTIPLEAGIKAALFDMTQEKAETTVVHSTTYGSFDNLLDGKCDVIFSTPLSEEQYKKAKEKNIELELTPVVYEGFVFVVNASNPVDTLTQAQIKDIYSGKITNWKEVGGNDAPIVAYQRNATSGSQNYMIDFMKDSKLMDPVTEFIPASMIGLMDAVAHYDNAENAIGYSVYAYAADMYGNGNEIKFIKVDGVEPTKETMASGKYPLLNYNYAIYNKNQNEDNNVKELVEWILTYNGQEAMIKAGYVPLKNIKTEEQKIEAYTQKGTGKQKPADLDLATYYYTPNDKDYIVREDYKVTAIKGLKSKGLEDKINNFIKESKEKLQSEETECNNYVEMLNKNSGEPFYQNNGIVVEASCINGYLSVNVTLGYEFAVQSGTTYIYDGYSKVYDLYSGNELKLSDLFYKDVDFISTLNEMSQKQLTKQDEFSKDKELKRTFSGIPKDISIFGFNELYNNSITLGYAKYNPYFVEGETFQFSLFTKEMSILYEERDMSNIWEDGVKINKNIFLNTATREIKEIKQGDITLYVYHIDTNNNEIDNKVNEFIDNYAKKIDDNVIETAIKEYREENNIEDTLDLSQYKTGDEKTYEVTISVTTVGRKKACIDIFLGFDLPIKTIVIDLNNWNADYVKSQYDWLQEFRPQ